MGHRDIHLHQSVPANFNSISTNFSHAGNCHLWMEQQGNQEGSYHGQEEFVLQESTEFGTDGSSVSTERTNGTFGYNCLSQVQDDAFGIGRGEQPWGPSNYRLEPKDPDVYLTVKNTFFHAQERRKAPRSKSSPAESGRANNPVTEQVRRVSDPSRYVTDPGVTTATSADNIEVIDSFAELMLPAAVKVYEPPTNPNVSAFDDSAWANVETVMMGNVPPMYNLTLLLEEIESLGFKGCYDFLHLPIKASTGMAIGCAFVNLASTEVALQFRNVFDGREMHHFKNSKVVYVCPAKTQGYDANYAHHGAKSEHNKDMLSRPLFLPKIGSEAVPQQSTAVPDSEAVPQQSTALEVLLDGKASPSESQACPQCDELQSCKFKFCIFCGGPFNR